MKRDKTVFTLGVMGLAMGLFAADTTTLDFEKPDHLKVFEIQGSAVLDAELSNSGKTSMRLDPGARAEWKIASEDGYGVLDLWVFDNMGSPSNARGYFTGPRWGIRQMDGTVFVIGELFAPYLNGAGAVISSESKDEKGWLAGLQHIGRNGRSGGWHRWTFRVDPEKGLEVFADGQSCMARSRFDAKKVTLKAFSSIVLWGSQTGNEAWSIWFDDVAVSLSGQEAPKVDITPVEPPKPPEEYSVTAPENGIAITEGALAGDVRVVGEPRMTQGHPRTVWDMEDVERYQAMMKDSPVLRRQAEALRAALDKRILEPVDVPQPVKNEKGEYIHVSDADDGRGRVHRSRSLDIANLGMAYLLFEDEKYAEYAKKLLLAYADAYPNYAIGARPGFSHAPSRAFDQVLGDAIWIIPIAQGYDFIYNYKGISPEERKHIEEDLLGLCGQWISKNNSNFRSATNWGAIGTAAVLSCGVAIDDEYLVKRALFGTNYDPKNKRLSEPTPWWEGQPNAKPSGMELHFSERSIDVDGMWNEGAMGYQFMALQALICEAETLWHHGIDLYRYRNGALKRLFDSPLQFAYPDLRTPAIHDSGSTSITSYEAYLYEYAYRRYQDPAYLSILRLADRRLAASYQQFTVSTLYDVDFEKAADPVPAKSVNLNGVGYGILRLVDERGTRSLLMDYGPNRSHGHPDKLNLDLWLFGARRVPDPGSVWYEQPLYRRWYHPTASHNTLLVDQQSQRSAGAEQLVYAAGDTVGIQRARTTEAWAGVAMDRAVFMTADYVADIFGAFSSKDHIFDLAWHPTGEFSSPFEFEPIPAPGLTSVGYNELANPRSVTTKDPFLASFDEGGQTIRLLTPRNREDTQYIVGEGHLGRSRPTAVYQRRRCKGTIYGNVLDYSKEGIVQEVQQWGSLEAGFGAMEVKISGGGSDLCYVAWRDGVQGAGKLRTNARQAFLSLGEDDNVRMAVLGGGTSLRLTEFAMDRTSPGLAIVERLENGAYIVANPSPEDAGITVTLPLKKGAVVRVLAPDGKPLEEKEADFAEDGRFRVALPAGGRVEVSEKGVPSMYEIRKETLRKLEEARIAEEKKQKEEALARVAVRASDAAKYKVPAETLIVIQAEDFTREGGGKIALSGNKKAVIGKTFTGWNAMDHWLEWTVEVPVEGYYTISLCYCAQTGTTRALSVNGEENPDAQSVSLEATGGWSNGSDDWQLFTIPDPGAENKPLLVKFKAGANTLRLNNISGGGANVDYLYVAAPGQALQRLEPGW